METLETREAHHDCDEFGLPPAPLSRDAAHNGHAAADASAMREPRTSPATTTRPTTSPSVASSASEHVEDLAVRVAVRARPLMAKERVERARECLSYPKANTVLLGESRAFRFDDAFGPESTQGEVYDRLVSPLVESCFRGYNATVLAYGQTGSGKTYTMGSGCSDLADDETGIIPRVVADVFAEALARADAGSSETSVRCAFLEVHNEEVRDLLHPDTSPKRISIRERADGAIVAAGAREVETRSADEMLRLLELGCVARTTGGTKMNAQSSRSHAIFTIIIEQTHVTREARRRHKGRYASAKFHLVDLAGSERNKKTRATGSRFQESININSGLLALGNVIAALSGDDASRSGVVATGKTHVPYRDSKLTRLLQDSLGGNSRTCVVACVSPVDTNFEETLNTLKYAQRARNVKNVIRANRDPNAARVAAYETEPEPASARADGVRATSSPRDVSGRSDALERVLARALVLAGNLVDAKQLSEAGLARLAACATERARSIAVAEGREGRPFPSAPDADRAVARVETLRADANPSDADAVARDDDDARSTTANLRAQVEALRREVAEATEALAAKDSALAEARDDLRRDEAIFADKVREIKALKREAKSIAKASAARSPSPGHPSSASAREAVRGTPPFTPKGSARERLSDGPNDVRNANDGASAAGTSPPLGGGALPANPLGGPGASAFFSDTADADAETRSLEAQRAEVELERARLKREAARHRREKKGLERRLRELARRIGSKEKRIVDLTRDEPEAALGTTARRECGSTRALEEMKASKEAEAARRRSARLAVERVRARGNPARVSSSENARAAEARDATRRAYEKKVHAAETTPRAMRSAKAESDALASSESESRHLEALRRVTDELAAAKATIRRLGGDAVAERVSGEPDAPASPETVSDIRALVDAETAKALARREREEERARLSEKREALLGEKRDLVSRRDALLARRARDAERLEAERARLERNARASGKEHDAASSRQNRETLARLARVRDALASGETSLRPEETRELRDAEDRADAVDAELDFVAAELAELAALDRTRSPRRHGEARGSNAESPSDAGDAVFAFSSLVATMPPAAARAAAAAAMARAVLTGLAQNETAAAAARLETQLGDAQRAIEEMERASRVREMDFDRRVTELRLEHGRREAALLALSARARSGAETTNAFPGRSAGLVAVGRDADGGLFPRDDGASEDDAGSLAPEDDDRSDAEGSVSGGAAGFAASRARLPKPPRLPATPVGVPRGDASRPVEDVFGVAARDAAARFARSGLGSTVAAGGDARSIREARAKKARGAGGA